MPSHRKEQVLHVDPFRHCGVEGKRRGINFKFEAAEKGKCNDYGFEYMLDDKCAQIDLTVQMETLM